MPETPSGFKFNTTTMLPVADLHMDHTYQRPTNQRRAKAIADNFDPNLFDPVTVTIRDDKWWVVDGGHRVMAAAMLGIREIPVMLVESKSQTEDAQVYVLKNSGQKALTTIERFKARVAAGDPEAVAVKTACDDTGWTVGSDLRCILAVEKAGKISLETLYRTLVIIREVREECPVWLVSSLSAFLEMWPEADDVRLRNLIAASYSKIKVDVDIAGEHGGDQKGRVGRHVLFEYYNKRLRTGKLPSRS